MLRSWNKTFSVKNCISQFLSGFTKDVVKVGECHENLSWKTKILHDDMVKDSESSEDFLAATGWLRRFMNRYGLPVPRKISITQKNQLIDKLVSFALNERRFTKKYQTILTISLLWTKLLFEQIWFQQHQWKIQVKNCYCESNWTRKNLRFSLPCSNSRWHKINTFHCFQGDNAKFRQIIKKLFYRFILKCLDEHWVNPYLGE